MASAAKKMYNVDFERLLNKFRNLRSNKFRDVEEILDRYPYEPFTWMKVFQPYYMIFNYSRVRFVHL